MKKTIAAGGASLLGLSAFGLGAIPAHAADDPVVDACLDDSDHVLTVGGVSSNWYMDCIPQYAAAGVEFTITSDTPFPDDFAPFWVESEVTTTSTASPDGDEYFGNEPQDGILDITNFQGDETSESYVASMILDIASVGAIAESELPAACAAGTFTNAYVVNYAPTTVSFVQTVDGEEWRYDVVATPQPLYLGLSILDTGVFDPTGSMCAVGNGDSSRFAIDAVGDGEFEWGEVAALATDGSQTLSPYFGAGKALPDVSRYVAPLPEEPVTPVTPQLAATGVDPSSTLGVAALFLALGVAGGLLKRRRVTD